MTDQSTPEIVYDLRRFAEQLPGSNRDLAKRVRQWTDSHSISTDVRLARDCVVSALRLSATGRESVDLAVMALMHSAVMAYSRALERHSEHRGAVPVKDRFSPEQVALHDRICHLRDEGLAHFGPAGTAQSWSEDFALLQGGGQ